MTSTLSQTTITQSLSTMMQKLILFRLTSISTSDIILTHCISIDFLEASPLPNRTSKLNTTSDGDSFDHRTDLQKYNHCLPVLNELTLSDVDVNDEFLCRSADSRDDSGTVSLYKILVHPMIRPWCSPGFETLGEVLDFLWQAFIGLQFIHKHGVALRRDLLSDMLMEADEMFPEGYHFIMRTVDPTFKHLAKYLGPEILSCC
ncbi:hypothetical protein CPB83DRAFT_846564 [Crepidotus variabilis]|uniref:Protein kinase domain-containing protein n=1 Tax=Crepidotus variabilis TaxID=179855 RepID=A0A9P6EN60_9AGAR|nr:hypothetical protein CPB83DRAFT_846564 [Crepidotus variabilis]